LFCYLVVTGYLCQSHILPTLLWWLKFIKMRKYGRSIHFGGAALFTFFLLEYNKAPTPWEWGPGGKWKFFQTWNLVKYFYVFKNFSKLDRFRVLG
jgi:hypothetical protein